MKGKEELIEKIYADKRKLLKVEPDITIADLLAARDDLAIIEKTSNSNVRKFTKSAINKVIIGQVIICFCNCLCCLTVVFKVPDRGGRTSEQAPPPPEMPSWQQRSSAPQGGRGGGGYRGGHRGDHQQQQQRRNNSGGYQHQQQQSYQDYGQQQNRSYDSAGSYSNDFRVGVGGISAGSSRSFNTYSHGGGFDSAGSFGGRATNSASRDYGYGGEPKRPKTYHSFQTNKSTYADQYVQESQHNQQYHPRRGGGGRSNYNRGGGRSYR